MKKRKKLDLWYYRIIKKIIREKRLFRMRRLRGNSKFLAVFFKKSKNPENLEYKLYNLALLKKKNSKKRFKYYSEDQKLFLKLKLKLKKDFEIVQNQYNSYSLKQRLKQRRRFENIKRKYLFEISKLLLKQKNIRLKQKNIRLKQKNTRYVTLYLKYKKNNLFFSIVYEGKVKFLVSSGMIGYFGKKKCSYLAMEKLVIKICSVLEDYLKYLHNKYKPKKVYIKILLFLDLYMGLSRIRKPLVLMFWYNSIQIHRIYIKNTSPHGGCRLKKVR